MLVIERINQNDLDKLSNLYYQLGEKTSYREKMDKVFKEINNNPDYYLLGIKLDGELVGTAMAIICNDLFYECKPFMVIENVIVDNKHQRMGYGTKLFKEIERIANQRGCYYIMLLSNKKRSDSHIFYKKLGYICDLNFGFKKYI